MKKTAGVLVALFTALNFIAQNPGIKFAYIDSSANPCNDFYGFCNGKWQKTFQLPSSDARYGSFNEINENNLVKIKKIYEEVAKDRSAKVNTDRQRLRDFYVTGLDSARADLLGSKPIQAQLAQINAIKSVDDLIKLKSDFDFMGVNLLFNAYVTADLKNSRKNIFNVSQGGYGLGDRDYYFSPNKEKIRTEYKKYLTELFGLIGADAVSAAEQAAIVFEFEKQMVDKALTRVELRETEKMYNIYSPKTITELTPDINWKLFFERKKLAIPDSINVGMIGYMKSLDAQLKNSTINQLKLYAQAQLLMESAPYLSSKFVDVHFAFRGKTMSGSKTMKPRWQRVHNVANASMGEILSQEFVKKHFTPEAKVKLDNLIDNLTLAYRERIASRDWMDTATKRQANSKLDLVIRKIGYPQVWKDYKGLEVGTESYWANVCLASKWQSQDNLNDLKKPVDRNKWQMTPVTVNAYYDPSTNEIAFPAAILQPPFFDATADDAANYGTMGAIIGHELTHGFDDQGAKFDAEGNMKMWWTDKDFENFNARTNQIVKQFDNYVAIDTIKVNGSLTQGENIADLGGLTMAYYAYKKSLNGKPSKKMGGFTGEQRFFIAWAQGWKSMTRDEELKRLVTIDPHSPAYFRAFAPLTNMKEFHEAFNVKAGDKMYTPESSRVEIW